MNTRAKSFAKLQEASIKGNMADGFNNMQGEKTPDNSPVLINKDQRDKAVIAEKTSSKKKNKQKMQKTATMPIRENTPFKGNGEASLHATDSLATTPKAQKTQNKAKMLMMKNGQLYLEEDDHERITYGNRFEHAEDSQSDSQEDRSEDINDGTSQNSDNESQDGENKIEKPSIPLQEILKELSSTVKSLEKTIRKMGKDTTANETKVSVVESIQSQHAVSLRGIIDKIDDQEDKIEALIGIVIKQDMQIQALNSKWDTAYAKDNRECIIVNGMAETQGENCYHEVSNFFKNVLKTEKAVAIVQAHRLGNGNARPMLVRLKNSEEKKIIFSKVGNLKETNKSRQRPYFITDRLPEAWAERKRYLNFIKMQNNKIPEASRATATINNGTLSLNGTEYNPPVKALSVRQMCTVSPERKKVLRQLEIIKGGSETQDQSIFTGYAQEVFSVQQVQNLYDSLKLAEPCATHICCAFRLPGTDIAKVIGSIDDGEHGGGRSLLNLLLKEKLVNRAVFVTRYYGGKHIGAVRFQLMDKVAQTALEALNIELAKQQKPLTQQELRSLNEEIDRRAEEQRLMLQEQARHPWNTEEPESTP